MSHSFPVGLNDNKSLTGYYRIDTRFGQGILAMLGIFWLPNGALLQSMRSTALIWWTNLIYCAVGRLWHGYGHASLTNHRGFAKDLGETPACQKPLSDDVWP
ncbi:hypothetical protein B0681_03970 [Moraxella porci DSM 25326]|uniref:Uncharacterized protein n=1 Tax=Moraxella porci DSM 25326 TaxID=573983 RepID=A0A1T0CU09_9GAMM|nr:hypothetical protein B0681_03970 [Moraxella porci DSM 25326]